MVCQIISFFVIADNRRSAMGLAPGISLFRLEASPDPTNMSHARQTCRQYKRGAGIGDGPWGPGKAAMWSNVTIAAAFLANHDQSSFPGSAEAGNVYSPRSEIAKRTISRRGGLQPRMTVFSPPAPRRKFSLPLPFSQFRAARSIYSVAQKNRFFDLITSRRDSSYKFTKPKSQVASV